MSFLLISLYKGKVPLYTVKGILRPCQCGWDQNYSKNDNAYVYQYKIVHKYTIRILCHVIPCTLVLEGNLEPSRWRNEILEPFDKLERLHVRVQGVDILFFLLRLEYHNTTPPRTVSIIRESLTIIVTN